MISEQKDKYKWKNTYLAFYRVEGFYLKQKVSTNEKYLPNIAFVGQTIGSEKKR